MKKILVACDKFKGSMTAAEACAAITRGITAAEVRQVPIADGGEGMSSAITAAKGGQWITRQVTGPSGNQITAGFGMIDFGQTAVIEMAEASGLEKVAGKNNPWQATTYGTGELIAYAIELGAQHILLGIGGSATNDAGTGMAAALGFRFIGADTIPSQLNACQAISLPEKTIPPTITVACDVTNPLLGEQGCTRIYGPQKGIQPGDFEAHESRLNHLVQLLDASDLASQPGAGAAGGLGFGCLAFLNAQLSPGFELVAQALDLERHVQWADLVITGEGKIDSQSLQGKAPYGLAQLARKYSKPVHAYCGIRSDDQDLEDHFQTIIEIQRANLSLTEAIQRGPELLEQTVRAKCKDYIKSM